MPLFGGKSKNPSEIVKSLKESVVALEKGDAKKSEKVSDFIFSWTNKILFFILASRRSGQKLTSDEGRFVWHG